MSSVLKGGRLRATRKDVVNFISSFEDDKRIANAIILVNEAHVIALTKSGAIERSTARRILRALKQLESKKLSNKGFEDFHVLIEENVTKRSGREIGGYLHLGKSRNDQVATAIRMTLREAILELSSRLLELEAELVRSAGKHTESVFPGYTHLQPAQPISFAHYLLANGDSLLRDNERLIEAYRRVNRSAMGAAAIAGTSIHLDRDLIARLLGFDGTVEISLDAVGSRDFVVETLSVCTLIALDLSRIAQDFIFYSSAEVSLIALPDEFTSTSSIMPQKKNPDPLELVRAKCAKVIGNLSTSAITLHGLPSGYNLDFQEITPLLWQSIDELNSCLQIVTALVPKVDVDKTISKRQYLQYTAATEVANVLVREEKIPFRTAHHAVGSAVRTALQQSKSLQDLTRADWERVVGKKIRGSTFDAVLRTLDLKRHLDYYRTKGSPNPKEMLRNVYRRNHECQRLLRTNEKLRRSLQKSAEGLRTIRDGT